MSDLAKYAEQLGQRARQASRRLADLNGAARTAALNCIADDLGASSQRILAANGKDIAAAQAAGLAEAMIERLRLNEKRIAAMAESVRQIAGQVDPVGQVIEGYVRPSGLRITRVRVPLGVICFIYESRPNVTSDAAALCLKAGNAVILRGGKEAVHSNTAISAVIGEALGKSGLDPAAVQMVESADRQLVGHLLKLDKYIDLVIPRGGKSLIQAIVGQSAIPVLKHYEGVCHIYVDAGAHDMADQVSQICVNAKTSYPGGAVCNAVEKILFHRNVAEKLLPRVCAALAEAGVEIRGDGRACRLFAQAKPATAADWDAEYLALIVTVGVVDSLEAAIDHINAHGSHHTDAILSSDVRAIEKFTRLVDSASVMVNASTRLADGGEYGLGAEIGISTDKLHARGPMGAADLTTSKWVVTGDGHLRT